MNLRFSKSVALDAICQSAVS